MNICQTTHFYQPFLQKKNGERIYSSRPLLVIQDGSHKVLCYLRDVDLSLIVRENEKYTFGVMKISKEDKTKKELLFEMNEKIHIQNLKKHFQNQEKGEVIWKDQNIHVHWNIILYQKEYIMTIPHITIKNQHILDQII